jgi:hypothetical protein
VYTERVKNKIEENYGDIDVWEHATKILEAADIFPKPLKQAASDCACSWFSVTSREITNRTPSLQDVNKQ